MNVGDGQHHVMLSHSGDLLKPTGIIFVGELVVLHVLRSAWSMSSRVTFADVSPS